MYAYLWALTASGLWLARAHRPGRPGGILRKTHRQCAPPRKGWWRIGSCAGPARSPLGSTANVLSSRAPAARWVSRHRRPTQSALPPLNSVCRTPAPLTQVVTSRPVHPPRAGSPCDSLAQAALSRSASPRRVRHSSSATSAPTASRASPPRSVNRPARRARHLGDEAWVCWFEAQVNKAKFFLRFAQNGFVT